MNLLTRSEPGWGVCICNWLEKKRENKHSPQVSRSFSVVQIVESVGFELNPSQA